MAILGSKIDSEFIKVDTFTGDGGVTYGPLFTTVESPGQIGVHDNGYYKLPSIDYTVDGTQITFTNAPTIGNNIVVLHLGLGVVPLTDLNDGSVTTNSLKNLVIPSDKIAEYSIHAGGSMNVSSISMLGNTIADSTITANNIVPTTITGNIISSDDTPTNTGIPVITNAFYFDGDYYGAKLPATSSLDFGSDDFTIEFWMKAQTTQDARAVIMDNSIDHSGTGISLTNLVSGSAVGKINFYAQANISSTNAVAIRSATTVTDNVWHHIACVKSGSDGFIFVDGIKEASVLTNNAIDWSGVTLASMSNGLIGRSSWNGGYYDDLMYSGLLSNIRITRSALYTSNFTVSQNPSLLTAISGTELLISNASNTFVDTSNNQLTITGRVGKPQVYNDYIVTYNGNTSITSAMIAERSITGNLFAAGQITGNQIAISAISGNQISTTSIPGPKFATNAIRANQIVAGTITGDKFQSSTSTPTANRINESNFNAASFMPLMTAPYGGLAFRQVYRNVPGGTTFTITIPQTAQRLKITAVGGGGGSGSVISAWDNPEFPGSNVYTSGTGGWSLGVSGQGGGGAGFVAHINGPFPSKTFNISIGVGGSGGLGAQFSNVANAGSPGGSTVIWNLLTANANISITANGGYGSNAYNALGWGAPTFHPTTYYTQPYPVYGKGGKGGIAGEANISSDFVIFHHAGFDGNLGSQLDTTAGGQLFFPGRYYNRAFVHPSVGPAALASPDKAQIDEAAYNPSARKTILGVYGQGGEMVGAGQGGFTPPTFPLSPQIALYWNAGRKSGNPGANGAVIIEY